MSSKSIGSDFTPIAVSIQEGVRLFLPDSSENSFIVCSSSSLAQITTTTVRNLPYVFAAKQFGINDVWHFFSSRVDYLEATLICGATLVHNLFMAFLYSAATVITLGLSDNLRYNCRKHWVHLVHACAGVGIGLSGIVSPFLGASLNYLLVIHTLRTLRNNYQNDVSLFEQPLIKEVRNIYKKHSSLINNIFRSRVSSHRFEHEFSPSLRYIERKLNQAQKMENLVDLIIEFWRQFPKMGSNEETQKEDLFSRLGSPAAHHYYEN